MHSCSALIGRLPCPCNGFQARANVDICDDCVHSFSHHVSSTTPGSTLEASPQAAGLATLRARSVTSLFQSLLKSTASGSLAIQETSAGLRKSGVNAIAVSFWPFSLTISNLYHRVLLANEDRLHTAQAFKQRTIARFVFVQLFSSHVGLRLMNW